MNKIWPEGIPFRLLSGILLISLLFLLMGPIHKVEAQESTKVISPPGNEILQFTSNGHVLGFGSDGLYLANGSYLLREEFLGTKGVKPLTDQTTSMDGNSSPLGTVTYPDLWPGITLTYDSPPGGIIRSTYQVEAGADPGLISLRYNVPVYISENGGLVFKFETGSLTASAPIAWQEILGKRVPVDVTFLPRDLGRSEVSFQVGTFNSAYPLTIDPTLAWHTFMGSTDFDYGYAITVDGSGNVYVSGFSHATWGSPVHWFFGGIDAFVTKLNSSGELLWNTFMGSGWDDWGTGIAVDGSGNVYVTGYSTNSWGSPVNAHAGSNADAFVAKLNSAGVLQWNTFLGSTAIDFGEGIAVDGSGNVYVTGYGAGTWGSPVNAHAGGLDAFAVKLNSSGVLQWNTFMGTSPLSDEGRGIAVDGSGNVYVTGYSAGTWGSPVNGYAGGDDVFAAKLNNNGVRQWNTFLGSFGNDSGNSITVDGSGNVYLAGGSTAMWGAPVNAHAGGDDAFAIKLNSSGARQWHTFLGSSGDDIANDIAVDGSGNIFLVGDSDANWGNSTNPHAGGDDAFAAELNSSGVRQWNIFMGSSNDDGGEGVAVDGSGHIYVTGDSYAWGSPVSDHAGSHDAFAVKLIRNIVLNNNNSGDFSMRWTIQNANSGDTILFDSSLAGDTITLASEITIDKNLTIDGSALSSHVQVSGDDTVRVFNISSGTTVNINHLDITHGTGIFGGGINSSGVLTVSNSYLSNNNVSNIGGAIANDGTLTITDSTIADNSAGLHGGGIFNFDTLTISGTTFTGNDALGGGGGGISASASTNTISNSTFYDNSATTNGGGILNSGGTLTVSNSTFSDNISTGSGGGIYHGTGTLHLKNNILANSSGWSDCHTSNTPATNINNLIEDGSCGSSLSGDPLLLSLADNGGPTETMELGFGSPAMDAGDDATCEGTDQRGQPRPYGVHCDIGAYEYMSDIEVNSLNDPGEGVCDGTECTLREAVDFNSTGSTISFESSLAYDTITLTDEIVIDKDMTIDGSDLVSHVLVSGGDSVRVFLISGGVSVELNQLDVIEGFGDNGGGINNDGSNVIISNSNFSDNNANNGGGIYSDTGTLTVTNCTFEDNDSVNNGGAVYNDQGIVFVANSTLYSNDADTSGAGIYNYQGILTVSNSTLYSNRRNGLVNTSGSTLHLKNTIVTNSLGDDCVNNGTLASNINNLIKDGTCSPLLTDDPLLDLLNDNGGPTQTMALGSGSPAIDAGDDATCEATDQRGVNRPQGTNCDIGAYEYFEPVVNSLVDPGDGFCDVSQCTLREAVAVVGPEGVVTFDTSLAGSTIYLGEYIDTQYQDLTIDGSGLSPHIKVSGNGNVKVFQTGSVVTIDHLDIINGDSSYGGGIFNYGTLTITNSTLSGNTASVMGGGVYNNHGSLTIVDSMISGNTAPEGGGIANHSTLNITNSTFSNNSADTSGGGIYNKVGSSGPGIMTVANSTFANNSAGTGGGGLYNFDGTATISNVTISANYATSGGGVVNSVGGTLHMTNSILADSTSGGDCLNTGTIVMNINNLIEDGTCSPALAGDPVLIPLADNGGLTETMAIGSGSPAIDAGHDGTCESTDQRGISRPQGLHCDIGSYEVVTGLIVNSLNDPGDGVCIPSECTLREAVATVANGDTITFDTSLSGGAITLGSEIAIAKDLLIDGSNLSSHIMISGGNVVRVFNISSGAAVDLDHLDILGGGGVDSGGGIFNEGILNVSNSFLADNSVPVVGGAIVNSGTLTVTDSTFFHNTSDIFGGGIFNGASLTVSGTTFIGNDADFGGGIYGLISTTNMISNSTFYDNNAETSGGGIYNSNGPLNVNNCTFSDNTVIINGGGIFNSNGTLHLKNSILANSTGGNDCYSSNALVTNINNLIGDGSCSPALTGDPLLGSLADNGGPTETMALSSGSPAIDTGNDATCEATDQRGVSRPQGDHCDMGSYEVEVVTYPYTLFLPLIMR